MEQERSAESGAGGAVKAYFEQLTAPEHDCEALWRRYQALSPADWLRVCLCLGGIGENQFGFGAEVGRG